MQLRPKTPVPAKCRPKSQHYEMPALRVMPTRKLQSTWHISRNAGISEIRTDWNANVGSKCNSEGGRNYVGPCSYRPNPTAKINYTNYFVFAKSPVKLFYLFSVFLYFTFSPFHIFLSFTFPLCFTFSCFPFRWAFEL